MMAQPQDCAFCRIIRHEVPTLFIQEDDVAVVFLDRRPVFPGHCLVVPREHYETLPDLPGPLVGPLFGRVQMIARAVEVGLQADGSFVGVNVRVSQSVPHLHIHVVPRRKGDGLKGFFWPRQRYEDDDAAARVCDDIRSALTRLQAERLG